MFVVAAIATSETASTAERIAEIRFALNKTMPERAFDLSICMMRKIVGRLTDGVNDGKPITTEDTEKHKGQFPIKIRLVSTLRSKRGGL